MERAKSNYCLDRDLSILYVERVLRFDSSQGEMPKITRVIGGYHVFSFETVCGARVSSPSGP